MKFSIDPNGLGSHVAEICDENIVTVPALSLYDIVELSGFDKFTIVCDIEGSEFDVFSDSAKILSKCWALIVELHPADGSKAADFIQYIESTGLYLKERRRTSFAFVRK